LLIWPEALGAKANATFADRVSCYNSGKDVSAVTHGTTLALFFARAH